MRRFINTTFFDCISNGVIEKNVEIDKIYDEFIDQLAMFCKTEQDLIFMLLILNYTKSEIRLLQKLHVLKQGVLYSAMLIDKSLYMIDSAIDVIQLRINNPKIFNSHKVGLPHKSQIYLDKDVGYVDIMEIACGLFYSGVLKSHSGSIVNFADIVRVFENGFNFKFSDIYKKRDEVIKRKPIKRVEFLRRLINAIDTESKNRGYL